MKKRAVQIGYSPPFPWPTFFKLCDSLSSVTLIFMTIRHTKNFHSFFRLFNFLWVRPCNTITRFVKHMNRHKINSNNLTFEFNFSDRITTICNNKKVFLCLTFCFQHTSPPSFPTILTPPWLLALADLPHDPFSLSNKKFFTVF